MVAVTMTDDARMTGATSQRTGCPVHDLKDMLRKAGLRPTRQRMALCWMLFGRGDRHVTAESLYEEAAKARVPISLATVYNTLHQFKDAGFLREVAVEGAKTYFDTNIGNHCHFFVEGEGRLIDIDDSQIVIHNAPEPPEGMEIARIDVVLRLRPKARN